MGEASSGWQAAVGEIELILQELQDEIQKLSQDTFQLDIVTVHGNMTTMFRFCYEIVMVNGLEQI